MTSKQHQGSRLSIYTKKIKSETDLGELTFPFPSSSPSPFPPCCISPLPPTPSSSLLSSPPSPLSPFWTINYYEALENWKVIEEQLNVGDNFGLNIEECQLLS